MVVQYSRIRGCMRRLAMKTHRNAQVGRAGTVFKIIMWAHKIPPRHSWAHEVQTSHKSVSSKLNKTSRWSEVSSRIRYRRLRKEFHQPKMPLVSPSCSQQVAQWDHLVTISSSLKFYRIWAWHKKALEALAINGQKLKETKYSQSKIIITNLALDQTFIKQLINLDQELQTIWMQLRATHLPNPILFTKIEAIIRSHRSTSMASFKCLAKNVSVRNS